MITNYHNELYRLLQNEYVYLKKKNKIENEEDALKNPDIIMLYLYADWLANNTFLMFYSYAEEWIFLKIKGTQYHSLIEDRGSITRFKKPLKQLGLDVSRQDWCILTEAEHIRNCLSHADGRIDLISIRDKDLNKIISKPKNKQFFKQKNQRLNVTREYLNYFKNAVRNILHHPEC
ncbi:TPA: hypothetical protein F8V18_15035 [Legionella pneumophila]|nr:hypothetical protein [Legionella pneumophila]